MSAKESPSPLALPGARVPVWFVVVAFALVGLAALIACSPKLLVFDEEAHLRGACLLVGYDRDSQGHDAGEKIGLHEMLVADIPSAPGPLYPVLHAAMFPLTSLEAPRVRFLNFGLFLLAWGALAFGFQRWRAVGAWHLPVMMLAIPATWATIGLAYTEIPAFTMAALGLAATAWATSAEENVGCLYLGFALAGLCFGLAITGRQTYLPIVVGLAALGLFVRRWRWPAWLAGAVAILVPLPMFVAWGGLMRRDLQTTMGGGFVVTHGVVAFAWLAATVAWLAPRFFSAGGRWVWAAAAAGAAVNLLFVHLVWRAYDGLLGYLPDLLGSLYEPLVGSVLVAACVAFATAAAVNGWRKRSDGLFAFALGLTVLLTATAFRIAHLYTPRYLMVGFPFVLLVAQPYFTPSKWAVLRLAAGAVVGALSLTTYYSAAYA